MAVVENLHAFLLTRHWRDTERGLELVFWAVSERGPLRVTMTNQRAVCFIPRALSPALVTRAAPAAERVSVGLLDFSGDAVDALYFKTQRQLLNARELLRKAGTRLYESDLDPTDRYLMERFITAGFELRGQSVQCSGYLEFHNPSLRRSDYRGALSTLSVDIETEGLDGRLYSVAGHGDRESRVFMVDPERDGACEDQVHYFTDEAAVLQAFFAWLARLDPDVVIGWNVIEFDLQYLQRRCQSLGVRFALSRGGEQARILAARPGGGIARARVPGRAVLDGIVSLRAAFWSFESYALEVVAQTLLGRGKNLHAGGDRLAEIKRLYREDKPALAAYNLEDCRLVTEIYEHTGLIDFAIARARITGLALDRLQGSVAAFDNLYLPRLHRRGRVAPDIGDAPIGAESPGGYVMDSKPGLYDNVLVLDFKSLYPSIVRTFMIDPLGLVAPGDDPVPGFAGAVFARRNGILPELVTDLWQVREQAKREGNRALSQAVKIIMNAFYGVLGSSGCRFHDARLATSITRRGQQILRQTGEYLRECGHTVIYGDTDSLFLLLGPGPDAAEARGIGQRLQTRINDWWRRKVAEQFGLDSYLEIEFETHYERFLMPTVRGSESGSKKRYAGMVRTANGSVELVFKGLESVRSDWTPLARRVQRELYRRIFLHQPFEDWLRDTVADLYAGRLDHELVYRKRLRRPLDSYIRVVPPHIQAARKLTNPGRSIRYVITHGGAEPVAGELPAPDYEHYRQRQLAPAVDGILHFLDTSFETITGAQLMLL